MCFVPLEYRCLLLGILSFVVSTTLAVFSILMLEFEKNTPENKVYYMKMVTHLEITPETEKILLSLYLVVEILWIFFSAILIFGLFKNRANFVLSYFFYGIVVSIVGLLTSLLLLLQVHWAMSVGVNILSMFYIYSLISVYRVYELISSGKFITWSRDRSQDELLDPLADDSIEY